MSTRERFANDLQPRACNAGGIYLARHTSARFLGAVEAANADAAIKSAIKEFEIKDEARQKRLIAARRA